MSRTTFCRMFGYVATIVMHVGNIVYLNSSMQSEMVHDNELKVFGKLQPRFFTCWTFFLQILHAVAGLIIDFLILCNSTNEVYKPPKHLKKFKDTLFSAILWPSTWIVFSIFWSLFLYDRRLIFPSFADKVVTATSNHIMHTAIIGISLWEVYFLPRNLPKSHKWNLLHLVFHLALYFSVLTYTYIEKGIWIYPIFAVLYGTVYFPLLPLTIALLGFVYYYMQWHLTERIWGGEQKTKKIR